jgi:hypothetical protein
MGALVKRSALSGLDPPFPNPWNGTLESAPILFEFKQIAHEPSFLMLASRLGMRTLPSAAAGP